MPRSASPRLDKSRFVPMNGSLGDGRPRVAFDPTSLSAAAAAGALPRSAPDPGTAAAPTGGGIAAPAGSAWPGGPVHIDEDILFLVHRATHGFSVAAYQEALAMGYDQWLEWQLDHENVDDAAVDAALAGYQTLDLSNRVLYETYIDDASPVVFELQQALLLRSIYSRKQLFERMVELWTDHFHINQLDDLALWWKTSDDKRTVRAHALGTFPDLLRASAHSSCMMWYLDNYANVSGAAQENWARELLELHTLGVDGPYTEMDVREVARCFTGWTFHGVFTSGPFGLHTYVNSVHDQGSKTVLGHFIPAGGGESDGDTVLDILAMHPKTAEHIAYKMAYHLLSYEPPQTLVNRVKGVYLQTGGDIKAMLREILRPPSVAMVPAHKRPKLKRPFALAVGMMRALGINSTNLLNITVELQRMGQVPYWWGPPNGYPDELPVWGKALLPRWAFNSAITRLVIDGNSASIAALQALLATAPPEYTTTAEKISWVLTGGRLKSVELGVIQAFLDSQPADNLTLREGFELGASSESFQYY